MAQAERGRLAGISPAQPLLSEVTDEAFLVPGHCAADTPSISSAQFSLGRILSNLLTPAHQLSCSHISESHLVLEAQGNIQADAVSCDPSIGEDGVHH